jgi:hypothetical protein
MDESSRQSNAKSLLREKIVLLAKVDSLLREKIDLLAKINVLDREKIVLLAKVTVLLREKIVLHSKFNIRDLKSTVLGCNPLTLTLIADTSFKTISFVPGYLVFWFWLFGLVSVLLVQGRESPIVLFREWRG